MMVESRHCEHRTIQTSAVIVLGASKGPSIPPPSPPTPYTAPTDEIPCEPLDSFQLGESCNSTDSKAANTEYIKDQRLRSGIHVLDTEALALNKLGRLYETDAVAREGFNRSVEAIKRQAARDGKIVVIGVGKSGHIGKKLVATFQSLSIRAVFLHPTEALHGDLGIVGPNDTLMFITYSGSTRELMLLLPHLDEALPTIVLTSHTRQESCQMLQQRPGAILLPAPVHELEKVSFGVSAPTTSTTVALALGDALAITVANELHPNTSQTFEKNHPGGAIGVAARRPHTLGQLAVSWTDVFDPAGLNMKSTGADLLRAGYDSKTGWVAVQDDLVASPSKIRSITNTELSQHLTALSRNILTSRHQMLDMSTETTIRQAKAILRQRLDTQAGLYVDDDIVCQLDSVIAVTANGTIYGVVEVQQILEYE